MCDITNIVFIIIINNNYYPVSYLIWLVTVVSDITRFYFHDNKPHNDDANDNGF